MLIIENTLVSDDLAERRFCCDYGKCKGACCVEGDAGAPLEDEEIKRLSQAIKDIYRFMNPESIDVVERTGVFVFDPEGKKVTPLVNGKECVFVVYKNEVACCAIEIAFKKKKIAFQKPLSCHLYPVRIIDYEDFCAVNYHEWNICKSALVKGNKDNLYMYEFLKQPLIRRFGKSWYEELKKIAVYMKNKKKSEG